MDSDIVETRFVDIVSGERVVQAVDFVSDDPAYAGAGLASSLANLAAYPEH